MKSRERVMPAMIFGYPDRVPISHKILPAAHTHHGKALNTIPQRKYAGAVCFRTDLNRQCINPFGTPKGGKMHIPGVFDHLGTKKRRFIACGEIGPDTPIENREAAYNTFMNFTC
jgi:hypothetical protein